MSTKEMLGNLNTNSNKGNKLKESVEFIPFQQIFMLILAY